MLTSLALTYIHRVTNVNVARQFARKKPRKMQRVIFYVIMKMPMMRVWWRWSQWRRWVRWKWRPLVSTMAEGLKPPPPLSATADAGAARLARTLRILIIVLHAWWPQRDASSCRSHSVGKTIFKSFTWADEGDKRSWTQFLTPSRRSMKPITKTEIRWAVRVVLHRLAETCNFYHHNEKSIVTNITPMQSFWKWMREDSWYL